MDRVDLFFAKEINYANGMIDISSFGVIIRMAAESVSHDKMTHTCMYACWRERERERERERLLLTI